jgi:hypothetical protein
MTAVAKRAARFWLVALPVLAAPSAASAITITVNGSVTSGYISGSVAGVFDITSALPLGYNAPYSITSASVTFSFQDDGDMQYTGQGGPYPGTYQSTSYAWWGDGYNVYRHYDSASYNLYYFDAGESANVGLGGGQTLSAASGYSSLIATTFGSGGSRYDGYYNYVATYSCGLFLTCYDPRTDFYYTNWAQTRYYYSYSGYSGPFSVTSPLTVSSIADLSTDGFLGYLVNPSGDFSLTGASLTFTAEPNVAPVPEPGTLLLVGSGITALALRRRRKA